MASKGTNYFVVLGIDPAVSDWSVIENAIEQRRIGWSRDLNQGSPQRRREAKRYLKLLPEITEALRDPERRQEIAAAAKELAGVAKQDILAKFDAHLNELRLRGRHVNERVLGRLVATFKDAMNRSEIVARLSEHGLTVGEDNSAVDTRQWPRIETQKMATISHLLEDLGYVTLYAFLDVSPEASLADIQEVINEQYTKVHRDTTANPAVNELLGYCMDIFSNAEGKEKYNNSCYHIDMATLSDMLDAKGTDGILEEIELQEILSEALKLDVMAEFAADFVERYAKDKGWTLTTDPGLIIQKLSADFRTTRSPKDTGPKPKEIKSGREDNYLEPLVILLKDGHTNEIPPRIVNDRLVIDFHRMCSIRQSKFEGEWAALKNLETAAAGAEALFVAACESTMKMLEDGIKYHGLPVSARGIADNTKPLLKEAESCIQSIWATLEELEEDQSRREIIRQQRRANRTRFVGFGAEGVAQAAAANVAMGAAGAVIGGLGRIATSFAIRRKKAKAFKRIGSELEEILTKFLSVLVSNIISRLQDGGVDIDQLDVILARSEQVEHNLDDILELEDLPSRVDQLKAHLSDWYYCNRRGVQGLFVSVLQLDDWEAELERCAPIFANCDGEIMQLADHRDLQVAVRQKLQFLFESPISARSLKQAALMVKSYVVVGDVRTKPECFYDGRAWTWQGDDGSWGSVCSAAISQSIEAAESSSIKSADDLRLLFERAEDGFQSDAAAALKSLELPTRTQLVRALIGGLSQGNFDDGDAAFLVDAFQLVDERELFIKEANNALTESMAEASLSDLIVLLEKLKMWCAAIDEIVWSKLTARVDDDVVRSFCEERLEKYLDMEIIGDIGDLRFLITEMRGEQKGNLIIQEGIHETVTKKLNTALRQATSEPPLSDLAILTGKLKPWCVAIGEGVWTTIMTRIDRGAVRSFCEERVKEFLDQKITEDIGELRPVLMEICGEQTTNFAIQEAVAKTLDLVLADSQRIPLFFLKGVRRDLGVDDIDELWSRRAALKVAADVERRTFDLSVLSAMTNPLFANGPSPKFYSVLREELGKKMVSSIDQLDSLSNALKDLYECTGGNWNEVVDAPGTDAKHISRLMDALIDRCNVFGWVKRVSDEEDLAAAVKRLRKGGRPVMIDNVLCWVPFGDGAESGAILVTVTGLEVLTRGEKQDNIKAIPHELMAEASILESPEGRIKLHIKDNDGRFWTSGEISSKESAETIVRMSKVAVEVILGITEGNRWLHAFRAARVMHGRQYVVRLGGRTRIPPLILRSGVFAEPGQKARASTDGRDSQGVVQQVLRDLCQAHSDEGVFSAPFSEERESNARQRIGVDESEQIYLIVDLTIFGRSNKKGIVFADSGIYWTRTAFQQTEATYLSWARFLQCSLDQDGDTIGFGNGIGVNVASGNCSSKKLYDFFVGLQQQLTHVVQLTGEAALITVKPSRRNRSVSGDSITGDYVLLGFGALICAVWWFRGLEIGLYIASFLGACLALISIVYPIRSLRIRSRRHALGILFLSTILFVLTHFGLAVRAFYT